MSEEKKQETAKAEEKPVAKKEEKPAEHQVKEETAKKEEKAAEQPAQTVKSEGAPAQPQAAVRVKASNCTTCNKVLKRGNWYYRNGKFFCNKRCWKKSTEKVA